MRGKALPIVAVVVGLLVVAAVAGGSQVFPPLDPRSSQPDGTRALVLLLEELGARVEVRRGPVPEAADTALVLVDRLNDDDRDGLLDWVEGGGVLVVADPTSPIIGARQLGDGPVGCPTAALAEVRTVLLPSGRRETGPGLCSSGLVQSVDHGAGSVVALGPGSVGLVGETELGLSLAPTSPLVNELLDEADNAVLGVALLAPTGGERVAFLEGSVGGFGDQSLYDLLGPTRRQALFQLLVAAVVLVLGRGRRLGRPVAEPQPVQIAGSELVAAVGRLLDARRRPDEAAAVLRAQVRRSLEHRIGVPADGPADVAARAVADRTGLDAAAVEHALALAPVTTDEELVALAERLDSIRAAVLGPAAQPATTRRT